MGYRVPAPDGKKGRDGRPEMVLPQGTRLQKGFVLSYFTVGGMSVAYRGEINGVNYFVKEVESDDTRKVAALIHEKQLLQSLRHPGIVKAYEIFEEDGFHYLVQEFIEGESLDRVISPLPDVFLLERIIQDWAAQLYDIFEYLHTREGGPVIYRDLKPSNIIKDQTGRIHLVDFGIARVFHEGKGRDTEIMGSTMTASPEHYGRGQTDVRSDIFTLGATLHYIATNGRGRGEIPFEFEPVRSVNPRLSPLFERVLKKALEIEPEHRFQSVKEMRQAHLERKEIPSAPERKHPVQIPRAPAGEGAVPAAPPTVRLDFVLALFALVLVMGMIIVQAVTNMGRPAVSSSPAAPSTSASVAIDGTQTLVHDLWPDPGKTPTGAVGKPLMLRHSSTPPPTGVPASTRAPSGLTTPGPLTPGGSIVFPARSTVPPLPTLFSPAPGYRWPPSPGPSRPSFPSPVATAAPTPSATVSPVALHQPYGSSPDLPQAQMPPVGSVIDGDVSMTDLGFRVRIPGYRRESPLPHELSNSKVTSFSFARKGSSGSGDRFLKIVVMNFHTVITPAHVRDTNDLNLRRAQAVEIEPLAERDGEFRSSFKLPEGFDNAGGEYICQQCMRVGKNGRMLYILIAASPSGERFDSATESEFATFFRSFISL